VLTPRVYNSDFVKLNYGSQMPGVFTLGEESKEVLTEIEMKKAKIDELVTAMANIQRQSAFDLIF